VNTVTQRLPDVVMQSREGSQRAPRVRDAHGSTNTMSAGRDNEIPRRLTAASTERSLPCRPRITILAPDPIHEGGVTRAVAGWCRGIPKDQVHVEVITVAAWDASIWKQVAQTARGFTVLAARLTSRSNRPDVLHLNVSSGGSLYRKLLAQSMARLAGVATLVHLHSGGFPHWVGSRSAHRWAARRLFTGADVTAVLANQWIPTVRNFGADSVAVIPGALPPDLVTVLQHAAERRRRRIRTEPRRGGRVVLFYGRWSSVKGLDLLAKAVNLLPDDLLRRLEIRIFGNGDGEWLGRAFANSRAQITIGGWLDDAAKEAELANADLFVLPSRAEGFAQTLVEAMLVGLPVVASDAGGIPEVLAGYPSARIVPTGDTQSLSEALRAALEEELTCEPNATACARHKWDSGEVVSNLLKAYDLALKSRRGKRC